MDLSPYVTSTSLTTTLGNYALTTALGSYMPKTGGTFTGKIALGVYGLKFTNTSGISHTLDRVILESLYNNYASWKILSLLTSGPEVYQTLTELLC